MAIRAMSPTSLHSGRNVDPHEVQRASELVAEVDDRCRAPASYVVALLGEDWRPMVDRVERLCEREGVLGEHRELERPDDLFDDLVQPGSLQHQRPELVAAVLASELPGGDLVERIEQRPLVEAVP